MSRRVVLFHSLAHARAAVAAAAALGARLTLQSAPGAAAYAGVGYLKAVVDRATEGHGDAEVEAVVDCGEDAGTALAALRAGWRTVRFSGAAALFDKLADIAAQQGARVLEAEPETAALDLLDAADAEAACREFLSAGKTRR